jgi:hypothetical protein
MGYIFGLAQTPRIFHHGDNHHAYPRRLVAHPTNPVADLFVRPFALL